MSEDAPVFDVVVIGGGVNGAGIARDAAMRGLSVALFEKGDFSSATSAWSSRLIHGGLRYLEYFEFPLVYESLNERRHLQRIAPHLVKPLRLAIPVYAGARRGRTLIRLGLVFYDLLSLRKRLPNHDMLDKDGALAAEPGLNADGLRGMARYYDAQVPFIERLVLENILDARAHGATVINHSPVIEVMETDGRVSGVAWRDENGDARHEVRARAVINATGPWVDAVLDTTGVRDRRLIGGTKGSHIVVSRFEGAPTDAIYVEARADGRPFFIIPWNGQVLIGTTDIRYDGNLDAARISEAETDYLISECNRVFPSARLTRSSVHYAYAGVRPLPKQDSGPESAITRKHLIVENRDIARGLYSIVGGKLTTYRHLAVEAVDAVADSLGVALPDTPTATAKLPGAVDLDTAQGALENAGIAANARRRLLAVYGARAVELVGRIAAGTLPEGTLGGDERVLAAEVGWALDEELAGSLEDVVHRRLMIGFDADQGRQYYEQIADLAAAHRGWNSERRDAELEALVRYSDSFLVAP